MKQQIPTLFGDIAAQLKEKMTSAQSQVLFPWSEEYQNVTETSNPRVQTYPWLVVLPASFADAQNAMLTLWNNQELLGQGKGLVRIAGGKHSFEGFSSVSGGIVISTSLLRNISIDTAAKTITFGAGALFEELYGSLNATMGPSFFMVGGFCPSVGAAAYAMGGGYNPWMSRYFGLAADNTISFVLIRADSVLLTVDKNNNPDLFWALRGGGGGNFGLVVQITQQLHDLTAVANVPSDGKLPWAQLNWQIISPNGTTNGALASQLIETVTIFAQSSAVLTDSRLGLNILSQSEHGATVITLRSLYVGNQADFINLLSPLFSLLPTPDSQTTGLNTWLELDQYGYKFRPFLWPGRYHSTSSLLERFTPDIIPIILQQLRENSPDNIHSFDLLLLANASKTGGTTGSFPYPQLVWNFVMGSIWTNGNYAEDNSIILNNEIRLTDVINTRQMIGSYINYIDGEMPDWLKYLYGPSLERLQTVKVTYDPTNFWSFRLSIPLPSSP